MSETALHECKMPDLLSGNWEAEKYQWMCPNCGRVFSISTHIPSPDEENYDPHDRTQWYWSRQAGLDRYGMGSIPLWELVGFLYDYRDVNAKYVGIDATSPEAEELAIRATSTVNTIDLILSRLGIHDPVSRRRGTT